MSGRVADFATKNLAAFYPASTRAPAKKKAVREDLEKLLTVKQTARQLKVSKATVYTLCAAGRLDHVRVMNVIRVPETALVRFLRGAK
jgi:excisionase family DNA binding protein